MQTTRRVLIVIGVGLVYLALAAVPGWAQGHPQPLPPLPDRAVIDRMIKDSQGPARTVIAVPSALMGGLKGGPFGDMSRRADAGKAVQVMSYDASSMQTIMPLVGAAAGRLQPDSATPDDGLPAQVIGVTLASSKAPVTLVAVWKDKSSQKPAEIRFYQDGKLQKGDVPYAINVREFKGDRSGKVSAGDQGVIIAARETCYTFGLDQVCYGPQKFVPDGRIAAVVEKTAAELSAAYDFKVQFDLDGGVAEVIGSNQRAACTRDFGQARQFPTRVLPNCTVNLVFTGVTKMLDGQPIGLFRVLRNADMKAYDVRGNLVGTLPAGSYLVLDATPPEVADTPGALGALFLVNANGSNHFLIPSQVEEGFGSSDDPDANNRRGQAAIKDGFIGGHGF
jgi:hypothetical protein